MTIQQKLSQLLEQSIPDEREREHIIMVILGIVEKDVIGKEVGRDFWNERYETIQQDLLADGYNVALKELRAKLWEEEKS